MKPNPRMQLYRAIESLPTTHGVYRFYDRHGTILYIGKAINLRSRVRSYFSDTHSDRPWVRQMIPLIADVRTLQVENDVEALILEANLIKKHKPKYNSAQKDDKRYSWIIIDSRSPFPRVKKTRDLAGKGRFFGPYPDGSATNHVLKYLRRIYPYADCSLEFYPHRQEDERKKQRRCVYHHLGLCTAPCDNLVTTAEYRKNIDGIIKTLQGKKKSHIRKLERQMQTYAHAQNFEQAAELRDKVQELRYLSQRIDIQYGDAEDEFKTIQETRFLAGIREAIATLGISIPEHKLRRTRIECYDISNLAGTITYGSMVVAHGTKIEPAQYRIFKVREEKRSDDPAMLRTVLQRRLKHLDVPKENGYQSTAVKQSESLLRRPDIILVDGAQPQLSVVRETVPADIGLMAISKGKALKRAGEEQRDEFWIIASDRKCIKINLENPFIFQHLRDEAHRFAIKHHRNARRFTMKRSMLDDIPGIGPKRKKALMIHFKSINGIKMASQNDLLKLLRNKTSARQVFDFLHAPEFNEKRTR